MRIKHYFYIDDSIALVFIQKRFLFFWTTKEMHEFANYEESLTFAENKAKELGNVDIIRITK